MASRGHAGAKVRGGAARAASGVFRASSREGAVALDAVKRLAARSAGRPLDDATRAEMEECFGHDFARVRVHTDAAAAEVAEALGADAVTLGDDIYFGEGEYHPGEELLAHELAHVAQRGNVPVAEAEARISEADEPLEQRADAAGREAVRGEPVADEATAPVDQVARTIALRATRPARVTPEKEPSLPLGEMRIVDRLAGIILGDFWKDPDDKAGRLRGMLERLGEKTRAEVIEVIEGRLGDADKARFAALVHVDVPLGAEVKTPGPVADDSSREQRQERTKEENTSTRNHDANADEARPEAGPTKREEVHALDEGRGDPTEHKGGEGEEAADTTGTADEAREGAEQKAEDDGGGSFLDRVGEALKKTFGLKTKKRKKKAKKGEKAKKDEKKGKKEEKDPEKPALKEGKGEGGESETEGEEKPEGAEVESKHGGSGEAASPAAGPASDAPVDTAPFDRLLLADRYRGARSRRKTGSMAGESAGVIGAAATAAPITQKGGPSADVGGAEPGSDVAGPGAGGAEGAAGATAESGVAAEEGAAGSEPRAESTEAGAQGTGAMSVEGAPVPGGPLASGESEGRQSSRGEGARGNEGTAAEHRGQGPETEEGPAAPAPAEEAGAGSEGATGGAEGQADARVAPPPQGEGAAGGAESGAEAQGAPLTEGEAASTGRADSNAPGAGLGAEPSARDAEAAAVSAPVGAPPSADRATVPSGERIAVPQGGPAGTSTGSALSIEAASEGETSAPAGGTATSEPPVAVEGVDAGETTGGGAGAEAKAESGAAEAPSAAVETPAAGTDASGGEAAGVEAGSREAADVEGAEGASADTGAGEATSGDAGGGEAASVDVAGGDGGGTDAAGGGGGGGGGSAIEDKPAPEPSDVSHASPPDAMAAVAGLPPVMLQRSLGGVSEASGRAVDAQRADLAQNPPEVKRPFGAPADHPPTANPAELAGKLPTGTARKVDALAAAKAAPRATAASAPEMGKPPPLPSPAIPGDGKFEAQNVAAVQAAVGDLPTTDPALDVTAGETPKLALEGEADPNRTAEQRAKNDEAAKRELEQGAKDAAHPMGEDAVYPHTPAETLKAEIPKADGGAGSGAGAAAAGGGAGGAGAGGAGGGGSAADDETASIVAQEQHGDEIAAHVNTQSAAMRTAQEKQDADAKTEKETSQKAVDDAINDGAKKQEQARTEVKGKVAAERGQWTEGQTKAVTTAREKGDAAGAEADKKVADHRTEGERNAKAEIDKGDADITKERAKAETTAREERQKAKKDSDEGFFGWIGSAVKSFFDKVKQAISDAFDAARKLIKAAIKKAQELAVAAIDAARNAIVAAIKAAGAALMAIGDVMLAAFPELRDKYKKAIQGLVAGAVAVVDALADELKKQVVAALALLGKALDALLGLLLDALKALVDGVASFVKGIIDAAKAVAQALGAFWVLIKDISAAPGRWISNLGAAVIDGIKHHLINAFKTTIKKWFNDTVEGIIGVGKAVLAVLRKGGITFARVAKMAWDALKAAIPGVLIQLLIEKLVALIVPAAGALMTIIEGIKAAWGSIQQIIAAFDTFMKFLKAVKGGNAGRLFAETLASAAIVVIQFVAQWLLGKLKGAGGKVGGKLQEIAKKILEGVKKVGRVIGRAARRVGRVIVKGVKTALKYAKKGAKWVGGKIKKVVQKIANGPLAKKLLNSPLVKKALGAVKKGIAKVKGWYANGKKKFQDWRERRRAKKKPKRSAKERLEQAVASIQGPLQNGLRAGWSRAWLLARLFAWRLAHRLSSLRLLRTGEIEARINPRKVAANTKPLGEDIKVGQGFEPSFAAGQAGYEKYVATEHPEGKEEYRAAVARLKRGEPGKAGLLGGEKRDVQTMALKSGELSPGRSQLEPGVEGKLSTPGHLGTLEIISGGTYSMEPKPDSGKPPISSIPILLGRGAKGTGMGEKEQLRLLHLRDPTALLKEMKRLEERSLGTTAFTSRQRAAFSRRMMRVAFIQQALEPARQLGVGPATALAYSAGEHGLLKSEDILSRSGKAGLMTPAGAASRLDTPQSRFAAEERVRRLGFILNLIHREARSDIIVLANGYDVSRLISRLDAMVQRGLYRDDKALVAEVVVFLRSYNGR
jgi:hypothetical protein